MTIKKGDRVRGAWGGPEMTVRAAGDSLAICEWLDGSSVKQETFSVAELVAVAAQQTQQAQQPQPTDPPMEG